MDSPVDHGSPASASSDDGPQDELMILTESSQTQESGFGTSMRDITSGSSSGKRRQPPGGFMSGPSFSAKNRRREEVRRTAGSSQWGGSETRDTGGRAQKEELVDPQTVERLREEWGDPFDDTAVKNSS